MQLSKEESYKQLLFKWLELWHQYPGEATLPAQWALKLAEQIQATAKALQGQVIPSSPQSQKAE
jgi:hypothetical protein